MRPAGWPPMVMSKKTTGLDILEAGKREEELLSSRGAQALSANPVPLSRAAVETAALMTIMPLTTLLESEGRLLRRGRRAHDHFPWPPFAAKPGESEAVHDIYAEAAPKTHASLLYHAVEPSEEARCVENEA